MKPIDVNIYILNLEEGKEPRIEKMPGQIIDDGSGYTPLIYHIGPNDFKVWYDDFEVEDLDITHLPLPNIIEIVTRRESPDKFALERIAMFCKQKLNRIHKELDIFEGALCLAVNELTQIYKEETEMNLNRTEELEIKKDIKGIKKALEDIASGIIPVKPTTQVVVKNGDPFFGKIHMSKEHMDAWETEFNSDYVKLVGLMEECAELQQAASKYYRHYRNSTHACCAAEKAAMIEEMAHVLIDIRMVCETFDISPEEIQREIYKKYPEGYDAERNK